MLQMQNLIYLIMLLINKIQNGKISLEDVKNNQEKFKCYLGEMKKRNKKHRSR